MILRILKHTIKPSKTVKVYNNTDQVLVTFYVESISCANKHFRKWLAQFPENAIIPWLIFLILIRF